MLVPGPNLLRLKQWLYWLAPHGMIRAYEDRRQRLDRANLSAPFRLPSQELARLFPGIEGEQVSLSPEQFFRPDSMVLPLPELLTLMALCGYLRPKQVFEIGTFTGESTLAMARQLPSDSKIATLDIQKHNGGLAFEGRPEARQITDLVGDSRRFDFSPYESQCDFVFVDADHSYPCVCNDTEIAFRLLKPGGVILRDDYVFDPRFPECSGVKKALEEMRRPGLFWISGTRFAVFRS